MTLRARYLWVRAHIGGSSNTHIHLISTILHFYVQPIEIIQLFNLSEQLLHKNDEICDIILYVIILHIYHIRTPITQQKAKRRYTHQP